MVGAFVEKPPGAFPRRLVIAETFQLQCGDGVPVIFNVERKGLHFAHSIKCE
jgi:hypothetical protein